MRLLDLTLENPAANIALDEALLEAAEAKESFPEILRLWEPKQHVVVIGRGTPIETEVELNFCRDKKIPVFRRCSGGASIVTGSGCLMYALLIDYRKHPSLRMLENAHRFVMSHLQAALKRVDIDCEMKGTCDLTIDNRKFSGNALRCKRNWMIYHGTLLCDYDLSLISQCLKKPVRQPDYRRERSHEEFVTNLKIETHTLKTAIVEHFESQGELQTQTEWPRAMTEKLVAEKYESEAWNFRVRVK